LKRLLSIGGGEGRSAQAPSGIVEKSLNCAGGYAGKTTEGESGREGGGRRGTGKRVA